MTIEAGLSQADDRNIIMGIIGEQGRACNCADAQAFGRRYREDGSFTNIIGVQVSGKAAFTQILEEIFRSIFAGSQIEFAIDKIHFLRPDVAVVEIDAALSNFQHAPPGAHLAVDGALHSRLQEVFTRDEMGWWIAAFHNVAVASS